ncbi:MAG: riboflavin biosynthesis protein RibF [Muribaculaceae bacterium]
MAEIITQPLHDLSVNVAATIGMFDGVHRGHLWLIEQLQRFAAARSLKSAVVTFRDHPQNVLRPDGEMKLIMPLDRRLDLIAATGINYIVLMDFTPELSRLDSRGFMTLLRDDFAASAILMGFNHRFGHNRNEQLADYVRHGSELGIHVARAEEYVAVYAPVSSSIIRRLLLAGDVAEAGNKMGRSFALSGTVGHGFARGRCIGFPTANVVLPSDHLIVPKDGVYAVRVALPDGSIHGGMANIGICPTFADGSQRSIEVHIIDFAGDIYGSQITVEFVARLRDERHMSGIDELKAQLTTDLAATRSIFGM